jgi:hypothetical protein
MPTMTIDELRAYWIFITKQEEFFYLLIFIAAVVVLANAKLICQILSIPVKLALSVAGAVFGLAIIWGAYQLFFG